LLVGFYEGFRFFLVDAFKNPVGFKDARDTFLLQPYLRFAIYNLADTIPLVEERKENVILGFGVLEGAFDL